ncbi:MAG TPA: hypothetical protein ENJ80_10625 [Gammaproteobacteria bacterium]|nr:hypothetical protein [Gammaproteobacteria bacterium]
MRAAGLLLVLACAGSVLAGPRNSELITAVPAAGKTVFYQIDSAGRHNIAASATHIALVWETVAGGSGSTSIAFKAHAEKTFSSPQQLSESADAFSPSITPCGNGFVVAWIAGKQLRARTARADALGPVATIAEGDIAEISVGCREDRELLVAWAGNAGRNSHVYLARADLDGDRLQPRVSVAVAPKDKFHSQSNPGVTFAKGRYIVSWHDRSTGTNLLYAVSGAEPGAFEAPVQINEWIQKSDEWGKGSSAIRNVLSVTRDGWVTIAWLDKRGSRSGYKVYATFSADGGLKWGENYRVSDDFSDDIPQWSLSLTADKKGKAVAAWMDSRYDENAIWMARLHGISWSDDIGISDEGEYRPRSPAVCFGPDGTLHAVWIEDDPQGEGMRIVYRGGS